MLGVYLGNDRVMTRLWSGHPMIVSTRDMITMPHLVDVGMNEPHVTRTLVSLISPGDVVVDVGANVGYYSVLGAWRSWPGGEVWAFEPLPHFYAIMSANLHNNGFSRVAHRRRMALSDREGTADMRVFGGYEATSTLRELPDAFIANTRTETGEDSRAETVDLGTLDRQMAEVPRIDVMKIDVEGHELSVLRGAVEILRRSPDPKVVMEFVPPIMGPDATRDLIALVRSLGLAIFRIETDGSFALQEDDARLAAESFADLLLVRR